MAKNKEYDFTKEEDRKAFDEWYCETVKAVRGWGLAQLVCAIEQRHDESANFPKAQRQTRHELAVKELFRRFG